MIADRRGTQRVRDEAVGGRRAREEFSQLAARIFISPGCRWRVHHSPEGTPSRLRNSDGTLEPRAS